jgi:hypothetical protein
MLEALAEVPAVIASSPHVVERQCATPLASVGGTIAAAKARTAVSALHASEPLWVQIPMDSQTEAGDDERSHLRPDVETAAESGLTLVESLLSKVIATLPTTKTDGAVRNLTICGMLLASQHARGAVSEFRAGRSYSAMALDRCMYEAMVRVMEWNAKPKRALKSWHGLVVYAAREEARRAGDDLRAPLGVNSKMPPGVQRDLARYLAKHRGANNVNESQFAETARNFWTLNGLNADQLRSDMFNHFDTPSLFVHCRPLVAEDIFDTSNDAVWEIRDVSRMAEPNARVLEIVRLLMLFARFIAPRFKYGTEPVDLVQNEWGEALERHEQIVLAKVAHESSPTGGSAGST